MKFLIKIILLLTVSSQLFARDIIYSENDNTGDNLALGYPVPIPVDSQLPVAGFRTYSSLMARHQDLASVSDKISAQVIGTTRTNRQIWSFIYSDADDTTVYGYPESGSLQQAGIHAREWSTPEALTGVMENFYSNENDHSIYQYLLENTKMVFTPVLNVDGFLQTQRYPDQAIASTFSAEDSPTTPRDGRMRRKNMFNVDEDLSTTSDFLLGVDLNRNNLPYWSTQAPQRSSFDNQSLVYHGASAASEPEIAAMQMSATLIPSNKLRLYIDTHSFSQIYFTPKTGNNRRDGLTGRLATVMRAVNGNKYRYGPFTVGQGIGATDEYFANTFEIPAYTLETEPLNGATDYGGFGVSHDGFILPESEVSRLKNEITLATLAGYYQQAGPASVEQVEISDDQGNVLFSGHWQRVDDTHRQWIETANTPLTAGTNYHLWVSFNKPMRILDNNNQISALGTARLVAPKINLSGKLTGGTTKTQSLPVMESNWLINPGGAPDGYLNYIADTLAVDFTLDNDLDPSGLTLFAIEFDIRDLNGEQLDANPATVADWKNGAWFQYESNDNQDHDGGGIDKTVRFIDDGSSPFDIPTSSPVPTPPPKSGGGSIDLVLLLLLLSMTRVIKFKESYTVVNRQ